MASHRIGARVAGLSPAQLCAIIEAQAGASDAALRVADEHATRLVEQPEWVLSEVLLSPDLVKERGGASGRTSHPRRRAAGPPPQLSSAQPPVARATCGRWWRDTRPPAAIRRGLSGGAVCFVCVFEGCGRDKAG
ncbi:hypothetical protein EMIHUDRAFT_231047 [Emiliania huxleyi CCMP1516]|uniref:Uncharacterized protein n=2 Tax=Emiliania huxleyi TaxID=2903 RepID=A0A0D3K964_EMIH1|nr:hypothetical protein EMIHUDRAFT_231047 [Emiliania huxleyi CCMP1516]EOD32299.1 hypothetical protein EMIHUDRAFT_231047 [Emiliania huxleyi CCMP1516]|eukprot:XP_005784728.1 hypothetical protein EMIHUDRAFT_231047 [Emiliania huxleyi CCMP1516]